MKNKVVKSNIKKVNNLLNGIFRDIDDAYGSNFTYFIRRTLNAPPSLNEYALGDYFYATLDPMKLKGIAQNIKDIQGMIDIIKSKLNQ